MMTDAAAGSSGQKQTLCVQSWPRAFLRNPAALRGAAQAWCLAAALVAGCGAEGFELGPARSSAPEPEARAELVEFIFSDGELPSASPDGVEMNVENQYFPEGTENLFAIDVLRFDLDYGLSSSVYRFLPASANGRLIIYHLGHWQGVNDAEWVTKWLLRRGYQVMLIFMPLMGGNPENVDVEYAGQNVRLGNHHDDLLALEALGGPTFPLFFEPVARAIAQATGEEEFLSVTMVGLSGGGWTTDIYSAMDTRIDHSYSISGSLPLAMRTHAAEIGDFEQLPERPLYRLFSFRDIYFLAAQGRGQRHRQLLHENDSCCFAWSGRVDAIRAYETDVNERLEQDEGGGDFLVELLPNLGGHGTYEEDLDFIHAEVSAFLGR